MTTKTQLLAKIKELQDQADAMPEEKPVEAKKNPYELFYPRKNDEFYIVGQYEPFGQFEADINTRWSMKPLDNDKLSNPSFRTVKGACKIAKALGILFKMWAHPLVVKKKNGEKQWTFYLNNKGQKELAGFEADGKFMQIMPVLRSKEDAIQFCDDIGDAAIVECLKTLYGW